MTANPGRTAEPYVPPPYPYDRLNTLKPRAEALEGGLIDLSIGTPRDPAPAAVTAALIGSGTEVGYPPSAGVVDLRDAARGWFDRRFDVAVGADEIAACIGTKEFVASTPLYLHMRDPSRDTILYPEVAYPSYAMGATLAGCRAVPVAVDDQWRLRLDAVVPADRDRALAIWVNSPGNPAGGLDELDVAAAWGREHGVTVLSDECYIEFTWDGPGRSILESGTAGVVAIHSLSKRSNFAGGRIGVYAGDTELIWYLSEMRKHGGMMPPGPSQQAAIVAFGDDVHVDEQRERYAARLHRCAEILRSTGLTVELPSGGFYLWVAAPDGDAWALTEHLATVAGAIVSPGEFYGPAGSGFVRLAMVESLDRLELMAARLGVS